MENRISGFKSLDKIPKANKVKRKLDDHNRDTSSPVIYIELRGSANEFMVGPLLIHCSPPIMQLGYCAQSWLPNQFLTNAVLRRIITIIKKSTSPNRVSIYKYLTPQRFIIDPEKSSTKQKFKNMKKQRYLVFFFVLFSFLLFVNLSEARSGGVAEEYWKKIMKNEPLPEPIKELLNNPFRTGEESFYTQVWGSNPRLYNLLQIEIHVSSSGESDLLNNYADYRRKDYKGSSTSCK
ncbi:hypothetical protein YC2023_075382 [Brassica napus]